MRSTNLCFTMERRQFTRPIRNFHYVVLIQWKLVVEKIEKNTWSNIFQFAIKIFSIRVCFWILVSTFLECSKIIFAKNFGVQKVTGRISHYHVYIETAVCRVAKISWTKNQVESPTFKQEILIFESKWMVNI